MSNLLQAAKQALEDSYERGYLSHDTERKLNLAIAQAEQQEPVAWNKLDANNLPHGETIDVLMSDGSVLCDCLTQADGDIWWSGSGCGEKFIDPKYAPVTHWRLHGDTAPPQREWVEPSDDQIEDIISKKVSDMRITYKDTIRAVLKLAKELNT